MKIGGLQKVSLIDYPGMISAVVFLQGCNFRCPYCHNPELVDPQRFEETVPEEDLFRFLATRRGKLDGVSITGGEPSIQGGLPDFIRRIKDLGFLVKLDTNGSSPDALQLLIEERLLDYVAMDIKGPLKKYESITGVKVQSRVIQRSIGLIMNSGMPYEFRTTAVKSMLTGRDFPAIVKLIENANRYVIQKYIPSKVLDESFLARESFDDDELQSVRGLIEGSVSQIIIR